MGNYNELYNQLNSLYLTLWYHLSVADDPYHRTVSSSEDEAFQRLAQAFDASSSVTDTSSLSLLTIGERIGEDDLQDSWMSALASLQEDLKERLSTLKGLPKDELERGTELSNVAMQLLQGFPQRERGWHETVRRFLDYLASLIVYTADRISDDDLLTRLKPPPRPSTSTQGA